MCSEICRFSMHNLNCVEVQSVGDRKKSTELTNKTPPNSVKTNTHPMLNIYESVITHIHLYAPNGLHKQISENEEQETKREGKKMLNSKFGFLHTLNVNWYFAILWIGKNGCTVPKALDTMRK